MVTRVRGAAPSLADDTLPAGGDALLGGPCEDIEGRLVALVLLGVVGLPDDEHLLARGAATRHRLDVDELEQLGADELGLRGSRLGLGRLLLGEVALAAERAQVVGTRDLAKVGVARVRVRVGVGVGVGVRVRVRVGGEGEGGGRGEGWG